MSAATNTYHLDIYENISCNTVEIKEYVQKLQLIKKFLKLDLQQINEKGRPFRIELLDKNTVNGVKARGSYNSGSKTIMVQLDPESVCHEVHHAAQHAALLDNENCEAICGGKSISWIATQEFSAIATGLNASSSLCEIGGNLFQSEVEGKWKAYAKPGDNDRALAIKRLNNSTALKYSLDRIKELGLVIPKE